MPVDIQDVASRQRELDKAHASTSQLVVSALDHIDGGVWLIAGGQFAQALLCFHSAIELVLKCELEKIHRALIADYGKLDYTALKSLLKEAFQTHPKGRLMAIDDFDLDKTITFDEAFKRSRDLFPTLAEWERKLKRLKDCRNDIAHYGGDLGRSGEYAGVILSIAIPFLEAFLAESSEISLSAYLGPVVVRELKVAESLRARLLPLSKDSPAYILKTVAAAVLYRNVESPKPTDSNGWVFDSGRDEFEAAERLHRALVGRWNGAVIGVECRICGCSSAFVGIEAVLEDHYKDDTTTFVPQFLACSGCGLQISPSDVHLAEEHFGRMSLKTVDDFLDPK